MGKDKYCRQCGYKLESGNLFCGNCGTKVVGEEERRNIYCKHCGCKVELGNAFCGKCGDKVIFDEVNSVDYIDKRDGVFQWIVTLVACLCAGWCLYLGAIWAAIACVVAILFFVWVYYTMGSKLPLVLGMLFCFGFACYSHFSHMEKEEFIEEVKGGHLYSHSEMTVGEAFEGYFNNPKWDYYIDRDELDIVEFQGEMGQSKIKIQFVVERDEFTLKNYWRNGKKQTHEEWVELMRKVYGFYK